MYINQKLHAIAFILSVNIGDEMRYIVAEGKILDKVNFISEWILLYYLKK